MTTLSIPASFVRELVAFLGEIRDDPRVTHSRYTLSSLYIEQLQDHLYQRQPKSDIRQVDGTKATDLHMNPTAEKWAEATGLRVSEMPDDLKGLFKALSDRDEIVTDPDGLAWQGIIPTVHGDLRASVYVSDR